MSFFVAFSGTRKTTLFCSESSVAFSVITGAMMVTYAWRIHTGRERQGLGLWAMLAASVAHGVYDHVLLAHGGRIANIKL